MRILGKKKVVFNLALDNASMVQKKTLLNIGKYKTKHKTQMFSFQQADVIFPSGKKTVFERVIRPPSVVILAFDEKERVLLTKEYRHKKGKYECRIPGGRVDKEKSIRAAAQRELREETGYRAQRMKLFFTRQSNSIVSWKRCAFLACQLKHDPLEMDEDEDITVVPTSVSKAYQMVLDGKIENEFVAHTLLQLHREWKTVQKWIKSKKGI